jgi:hypothetical protein
LWTTNSHGMITLSKPLDKFIQGKVSFIYFSVLHLRKLVKDKAIKNRRCHVTPKPRLAEKKHLWL